MNARHLRLRLIALSAATFAASLSVTHAADGETSRRDAAETHAPRRSAGHEPKDSSSTDHGSTDHGSMDHDSMDHGSMDHGSMDHGSMDHGSMDHGSMDHGSIDHGTTGATGPALPPITDADRAAAFPDLGGMRMQDHMDDDPVLASLAFDRLEWQDAPGGTAAWETKAWVGQSFDRLWLRSEGERSGGRLEHAQAELLWGHAFHPWWDLMIGIRHDFAPGASKDWLAIGVQGLAPYKFETQATAYLAGDGRIAATFEAEYELLLTNRLILQPLVEARLYSRTDAARGTGAGLDSLEAGLRLRYEIRREFAPYVGWVWQRRYGDAADLARAHGEPVEDGRLVAGLRVWF
ncbi:MAG TPA: copper resistance protein B [Dokdonella sp.]|uniref:copper resistance protein B n=1 Tax=Dokdonella sp. TaxID=2291710 RepID=UPI002C0DF6BC|nr:copper resistance protein B [Dokdonella sp.]HUD43740.1 copper resistance protein B [Dokdonella sp.]